MQWQWSGKFLSIYDISYQEVKYSDILKEWFKMNFLIRGGCHTHTGPLLFPGKAIEMKFSEYSDIEFYLLCDWTVLAPALYWPGAMLKRGSWD